MSAVVEEASFSDFERQLQAKDARIKELEAQLPNSTIPLLPLPLQYPANLIFAQNMVAMSMSQLQSVDLTIAQLRFHLREQALHAMTASLPSSQAGVVFSAAQAVPAQSISEPAAEPVAPVPAGVEADAAAPAAAEGGGVAAPLEHLWAHRRRLAAAVKIAFVMILLEVRTGWFFVYFFAVFLYIGGIFDPIIDWFQRRPVRVTLEQQLTALRNRQRNPPPVQTEQAQPAATAAVGGSDNAPGGNASAESPGSGEAAGSSSTTSADPTSSADASAASSSDRAGASGVLSESTNEADGADAAAVPPPPPLPYWHRFTYQLVVMFFMTLLPWWNPDPRYL